MAIEENTHAYPHNVVGNSDGKLRQCPKISSFYRCAIGDTEKQCGLLRITQVVNGKARTLSKPLNFLPLHVWYVEHR